MSVLRNRRVLLFPDLGATDYWNSKMEMIRSLGIEVSLFDFMERNATKEERDAGYDIADFLLREETKEAIFNRLITLNPTLKNAGRNLRFTAFSNGSTYPERTFQTMTVRCLIHFFFTGASLCRCITFPGHLLTSKEGETAPEGHNY